MVPLVRSLISIPAGMSNMRFGLFLLFTTIGTLAWNTILVLIGAALGDSWEQVLYYMDIYSNIVYVVLAIGAVALVALYIRKRRKSQSS